MLMIFMPETASAPASARKRYAVRTVPLIAGFVGLIILPRWVAMGDAGNFAQLVGIVCLIGVIAEFVVLMRALDELQFKLHMIALAAAGGVVTVGATVWGLAGLVLGLGEVNSIFALPAMALTYYAFLLLVSRWFS